MASDLRLIIFDPRSSAVVADRWLGMGGTVSKLEQVLQRAPDYAERGYECWGRITAQEASLVAEASYMGGASPSEIAEFGRAFPDTEYWWIFTRNF